MEVVLIKDVKSEVPTVRNKLIGRYARVEPNPVNDEEYLVSLINDISDSIYIATEVEPVDKYPENFKAVTGVELSDEEIDSMVDRAYEHEGDMTVRTGEVVVIKFNGKVYVTKNPEVNDRV